jgi:MFS family permease
MTWRLAMEKRIVRTYLFYKFLFWFPHSFVFATYILFLREAELSFAEIGIVNLAFMVSNVVLEIPTGVVADFFGRKVSIVLGIFVAAGGLFAYYFSHGLWGFVFAESVAALGATLLSGADEAWIKDSLDFNGYGKKVLATFSWGDIVERGSTILGGAAGGLVGVYNLRLNWLIAGIGVFVAGVVCVFMIREDYFERKAFGWRKGLSQMRQIFRDSVSYGYRHKIVWSLVVVGALGSLSTQALNMFWSVYFSEALGVEIVSSAWALLMFLGAVGLWLANSRWMKKTSHRNAMSSGYFATALFVFVTTIVPNGWVALVVFGFHEIGRNIFDLRRRVYLQENVPSDKRATIVSFSSMFLHFGAAIGWVAVGLLADEIGIICCWQISAALLFVAMLFALKLSDKGIA